MKPIQLFVCCWLFISQLTGSSTVSASSIIPQPCPVAKRIPILAVRDDISSSSAILDFLSNGGTPQELERILIARKAIQRRVDERRVPITPFYLNRGGVRTADFNGDKFLDVAVSLLVLSNDHPWTLFVYICDGSQFRQIPSPLLYILDPYTHKPKIVDRAPKFIYVGDLNNDGRAELVYDMGVSGASTIWMDVEIAGWDDQTQDMRSLKGDENAYPADSGSYQVVNAANGLKALVVRTGFSGSGIASGPQRQFTLNYEWNGKQFIEVEAVGDPSSNRLHVAYDALTALNRGNFKTAVLLYNTVLYNKHLEDWNDDPDMRNLLKAHAAYGLVLVRTKQYGYKSDLAQQKYQHMQQLAQGSREPESLWFKYGEIFWETARNTGDLHRACQQVKEAIQADIAALPKPGPGGIHQLGIWPWFTYNINWIPTERGLSFCPY